MAAKSDNILQTAAGITVTIVIVVGLFYLLKKLFSGVHLPGSGAGIGGPGGPAVTGSKIPAGDPGNSIMDKIANQVENVEQMISGKKTPANTAKITGNILGNAIGKGVHSLSDALEGGLAARLSKANKAAGKYKGHPGTEAHITKTLNAVSALPDADFRRVIADWKIRDGIRDIYHSNLYDSLIGFSVYDKGAQSRFIGRIHTLGLDK